MAEAKDISGDGKFDEGKLRYDLLSPEFEAEMAKVLTDGAKTHGEHSWKTLPNARDRYYAALRRHLAAWKQGEELDKESGSSHMAHVAVNAMFLRYFKQQEGLEERAMSSMSDCFTSTESTKPKRGSLTINPMPEKMRKALEKERVRTRNVINLTRAQTVLDELSANDSAAVLSKEEVDKLCAALRQAWDEALGHDGI